MTAAAEQKLVRFGNPLLLTPELILCSHGCLSRVSHGQTVTVTPYSNPGPKTAQPKEDGVIPCTYIPDELQQELRPGFVCDDPEIQCSDNALGSKKRIGNKLAQFYDSSAAPHVLTLSRNWL
jgi:hypothetical protein